jgi:hypothetical protein
MALVIQMNQGGGAPEVEDGITPLRFDDIVLKPHPDWAGTDKFGKNDTGERYHFLFTVLEATPDKGVYAIVEQGPDSENAGDPLALDSLTRTSTGEKSNFYALVEGILTPAELGAFKSGSPFDMEAVKGRVINGMVAHNEKGWPTVKQTLGPIKGASVAG